MVAFTFGLARSVGAPGGFSTCNLEGTGHRAHHENLLPKLPRHALGGAEKLSLRPAHPSASRRFFLRELVVDARLVDAGQPRRVGDVAARLLQGSMDERVLRFGEI